MFGSPTNMFCSNHSEYPASFGRMHLGLFWKCQALNIFSTPGITNSVNVTELRLIATDPDETHTFFSPTFSSLTSIKDHVLSQLCYGSLRPYLPQSSWVVMTVTQTCRVLHGWKVTQLDPQGQPWGNLKHPTHNPDFVDRRVHRVRFTFRVWGERNTQLDSSICSWAKW